ncbi:MAG: hypothetical protein LUD27_08150 [Clostridia bacterium]|nr:hypothetical protein [Clostridia bacterium]
MRVFDLFKLILKNALRVAWICLVFALLFAVTLFVNFVKGELSSGFYDEIISEAGNGYFSARCDYSPDVDCGGVDSGVYYSASGETYNVAISDGQNEIQVDSYFRGFNICKVFSVWQNYVTGEEIQTGTGGIWIYEGLADSYGICAGQSLKISGDSLKTYTVCGSFQSEISESLGVAYTPSFLIADGGAREGAEIITLAKDVYSLYLADIGDAVTDDGGVMALCEGYRFSQIAFNALLAFFCVAAWLLVARMAGYFVNHFSTQTFLFSAFGLSKARQTALYIATSAVFGLVSLAAGVGIFYLFAGVTQSLSISIMSMKFTSVSPGIATLYAYLAYLVAAAVAVVFSLYKKGGRSNGGV